MRNTLALQACNVPACVRGDRGAVSNPRRVSFRQRFLFSSPPHRYTCVWRGRLCCPVGAQWGPTHLKWLQTEGRSHGSEHHRLSDSIKWKIALGKKGKPPFYSLLCRLRNTSIVFLLSVLFPATAHGETKMKACHFPPLAGTVRDYVLLSAGE